MCDICGRMFCPPSCPSYEGRDAERGLSLGRCAVCGAYLYEDSDFFVDGYKLFCDGCRGVAENFAECPTVLGSVYRKEKNDRGYG